ncbi:hypothetical protein ABH931_001153 [Streptacidiphilus sp. MAP12-33]|uniref:hypothetical protein n=1 Tax=Streptacidiphilus sp. MAP12-33 TaxID=3156266 RepID=UPI003512E26B
MSNNRTQICKEGIYPQNSATGKGGRIGVGSDRHDRGAPVDGAPPAPVVRAGDLVDRRLRADFGLALIPSGRLGDDYGRKKILLIGMALFTLTGVLAGVAPDATWLLVA